MYNIVRQKRLIESQKFFFLFGVLFVIIFYAVGFIKKPPTLPQGTSISRYIHLYGIYLPLLLGVVSILKSYLLAFIIYILHINHWILKVGIYLLIYGFWLTLGIQLYYYEPRYTEFAIVLIDQYSLPLMISSGVIIIGVIFSTLIKKK